MNSAPLPTLERLLIVGLGSIGRRHARIAKQLLPQLQIAALRREARDDVAEVPVDQCVTDIAQALRFRPQAAVICNPATHHLPVARELARAGVHLLVEKPISSNTQGVLELVEACQASRATLMVGYNLRFMPSLKRFRQLLAERIVGPVLSVRAEIGQFLPSWRPGTNYQDGVSARAALGGGVLLELSHEIDYLRWLFGSVNWVNAFQGKQSRLQIDVEDMAHLILGFAAQDGPSRPVPLVATLNMDFVRHDPTRTCVVIGEAGSLRWDGLTGQVDLFERDGVAWQTIFTHRPERDESYVAEWRHFIETIGSGASPLISGHDGLEVLRVIEAARRSADTKTVVPVHNSQIDQSSGREP